MNVHRRRVAPPAPNALAERMVWTVGGVLAAVILIAFVFPASNDFDVAWNSERGGEILLNSMVLFAGGAGVAALIVGTRVNPIAPAVASVVVLMFYLPLHFESLPDAPWSDISIRWLKGAGTVPTVVAGVLAAGSGYRFWRQTGVSATGAAGPR